MSFDDLSSELWLDIIQHVGSRHFRRDLRHLTLCKRWYEIAYPILYQDVDLTANSTYGFIEKMEDSEMKHVLERSIRSVFVLIDNSAPASHPLPGDLAHVAPELRGATSQHELEPYRSLSHWIPKLAALSKTLNSCKRLSSATLTDKRCAPKSIIMLTCDSFIQLISAENLTCLNLDLAHTEVLRTMRGGVTAHVCENLLSHYPNLQELRIRLRRVCTDAITVKPDAKSPPLRVVVINLNLTEDMYGSNFPVECFNHDNTARSLLERMQEAAKHLVPHLDKIRIFTILSSNLDGKQKAKSRTVWSYDQLTGTSREVELKAPWYDNDRNVYN